MIVLSFDPQVQVGDLAVRWQTLGVTAALLVAFGVAGLLKDRFADARAEAGGLRLEDMIYIVLGAVPGAVVGGRLVHGLVFWEFYAADPLRLVDTGIGSLSLTGAMLGGTASAIYVARLVGAPVRRWADAAVVPLLLAMGLGKLAQLLGGSGQGAPFDGPWAVAFSGAGPWIGPTPEIAAHPAQVYEGLWLLAGIPVIVGLAAARRIGRGRLFAGLLAWFLVGRIVVGFTWRDDPLIGPLNAEQTFAGVVLLAVAVALVARRRGADELT